MGTTLTKLSGNYIYTARDGTKVEFLGTPFDRQDIPCAGADANSCRVPLTITKPNGLKFTFTYGTANSTYKRLQRVDSSAGYRMDIAYATNNPGSGTPSDFWYQRTSVTFTNIASPPNPLPAIAYAYSDSGSQHEVDVTDPAGRTWILKTEFKSGHPENPVTLSSVESPAGGSKVSYSYGSDNTVDGAYRRGATTIYSRVVSGTTATVTSTDALNNATVAVVDLTLGRVTSITDPLNRTTNFEYGASGRLSRTILPEGNATRLGRDGRGNVETTILEPKSGSSLGNIKTSANFDDTCTNVVSCNKPNSTTDAKGNVTDYTTPRMGVF